MSGPTPMEMLREYRRQSPEFNIEQAEMFKGMSGNDKTELLFHMLMHTNGIVQWLHGRLDGPQPTRPMDDLRTETQ